MKNGKGNKEKERKEGEREEIDKKDKKKESMARTNEGMRQESNK